MNFEKNLILAQPDRPSSSPAFTEAVPGRPVENPRDEADILEGEDQNDSMIDAELEPLEDEPADFMRGEVDVKEQMDRAARALDASIKGIQDQGEEDSPKGELGSSFKDTPGGLEQVERKTDQDMARAHTHKTKHGHETGALTDVGAGKSGATRPPEKHKTGTH